MAINLRKLLNEILDWYWKIHEHIQTLCLSTNYLKQFPTNIQHIFKNANIALIVKVHDLRVSILESEQSD